MAQYFRPGRWHLCERDCDNRFCTPRTSNSGALTGIRSIYISNVVFIFSPTNLATSFPSDFQQRLNRRLSGVFHSGSRLFPYSTITENRLQRYGPGRIAAVTV
jgi:hypothetical protein